MHLSWSLWVYVKIIIGTSIFSAKAGDLREYSAADGGVVCLTRGSSQSISVLQGSQGGSGEMHHSEGHWDMNYLGETKRRQGCPSLRVPVAEEAQKKLNPSQESHEWNPHGDHYIRRAHRTDLSLTETLASSPSPAGDQLLQRSLLPLFFLPISRFRRTELWN